MEAIAWMARAENTLPELMAQSCGSRRRKAAAIVLFEPLQ
jgi:hypothetical protein